MFLRSSSDHEDAYYFALRQTQTTWQDGKPDWDAWLVFFLRTLHRQTQVLQERLAQATPTPTIPGILTPDARKILNLLASQTTLTTSQAAAATGIPLSTVKIRLKELITAGLIEAHGRGKGVFYEKR